MSKQKCKYTDNQKRLKYLLVMRSAEKTEKYNDEINRIQSEIDYFEFGIK